MAPEDVKGTLKCALEEAAEQSAFEKLICALYLKPHSIDSVIELSNIARLASFYCTLRMVSTSLHATLPNSPGLIREIPSNCVEVLIVA